MKKLLSIVLALSLCLTAMMGCFVVSAETNTAKVSTTEITQGTTEATVDIDFASTGFSAAIVDVTFPNLDLTNITCADETVSISHNASSTGNVEDYDLDNGSIRLIIDAIGDSTVGKYTAMKLTLTFTVASDIAVASYPVTITNVDAGIGGTYNEETQQFEGVESPVTFTYTPGAVVVNEAVVECEHTNTTYVSATPATSTALGTIVLMCDDCSKEITENVTYVGGYKVSYITAVYESEVRLDFSMKEANLNYGTEHTDAYAVITKPMANEEDDKVYVKNIEDATYAPVSGVDCYTWSIGIPAKEYTDVCSVYVYRKGSDGIWYNGSSMEMSMASYCQAILGLTDTSPEEKNLIANVLNYGAKAQAYFNNYNIDDLATDYLGEYTSLIPTTVPSFGDTSSIGASPSNFQVAFKTINAVCESKVLLHATYSMRDGYDMSSLTFEATLDGETTPTIFVAQDNATDEQIENGEYYYSEDSKYAIDYAGFNAKDLRKKVTIIPTDNGEAVGKAVSYSIEDLIAALINEVGIGEAETAMYHAMLHYSDAAAAMFG